MTGHLKTFSSSTRVHVSATHMCPSINPYEPYFHLAEVMTVHMILERGIVSIYALTFHFHLYLCSLLHLVKLLNLLDMHKEAMLLPILHSRGVSQANTQTYLAYKGTSWISPPISCLMMKMSMFSLSLGAFMRAKSGEISIASLFIRAIGMLLGFSYMAVYTTIDEFHFQIAT